MTYIHIFLQVKKFSKQKKLLKLMLCRLESMSNTTMPITEYSTHEHGELHAQNLIKVYPLLVSMLITRMGELNAK
jgi:hypothetical protein